ncbi:MAG: hypothetical protein ACLFSY_02730 [Desulfonatronovibrionaceae bacterium]
MDLQKAATSGSMLGREFLTWLWYKSETGNGFFRTAGGEDFMVYISQKVTVESGEDDSRDKTVSSGVMSELREARLGVASGKKVVQATFKLEQNSDEWQVQLSADDFSVSGLKTPKVDTRMKEGDDPDALFLEKMYLVHKAQGFVDELFRQFLGLRLDQSWPAEAAAVQHWASFEG